MNHRAASDGRPLVEPLYHRWPSAPEAYDQPNQFLFGSRAGGRAADDARRPAHPARLRARLAARRAPGSTCSPGWSTTAAASCCCTATCRRIPVLAPAGAIVPLDGAAGPRQRPGEPVVARGAGGRRRRRVVHAGRGRRTADGIAPTPLTFSQATGTFTVGPATGSLDCLPGHAHVDRHVPGVRRLAGRVRRRRRRRLLRRATTASRSRSTTSRSARRSRSRSATTRSSRRTTSPAACSPCWTARRSATTSRPASSRSPRPTPRCRSASAHLQALHAGRAAGGSGRRAPPGPHLTPTSPE